MLDPASLDLSFSGPIWSWRGPSPYHFVTVPEELCFPIHAIAAEVTYGWGMIPVSVTIGRTDFTTALFAKDGGYVLPLKDKVRAAEGLAEGDVVDVRMTLRA